jgi:hypothetical protein
MKFIIHNIIHRKQYLGPPGTFRGATQELILKLEVTEINI